jgi:hypothetical protein
MNSKPNNMARNSLKYIRIDAQARAAARRKWNQPVAWPVVLALGLIAIAAIPAVRSYRRRERMAARPA